MENDRQDAAMSFKEAAERVEAAKAADKDALWIGSSGAGLAVIVLVSAALASAWWAVIVIAIAFALPYRIAKIALYRWRGLGALSLSGDLQSHTVSPPPPAPEKAPEQKLPAAAPRPRSALVPRLDFAPHMYPHEVLLAKTVGVETLRGGQPGVDFHDLPLGVFLLTQKGLAFLPAARGRLEELIGEIPAAALSQVAGELFEPLDFVERLRGVAEITKEPPTVAQWMATALKQKHHFVIAWGDLTGVMLGREHMVLTRDTGSGESEDFIILDASPSWPQSLMQHRIVTDLKEAVHAKILHPKYAEFQPVVRGEMDPGTPETGINDEAARRTMAWFSNTNPGIEAAVKQAMAPALEDYAILPAVVENQPWLFSNEETGPQETRT